MQVEPIRPSKPFAETIKAGRQLDDAKERTWDLRLALAKALYDECGAPGANGKHNGSSKRLKQAHQALADEGIHFDIEYLRDLRQFWSKFSDPGDRSPRCSWTVHLKCGNPETLRAVIAQARADGKEPEEIRIGDVATFLKQRRLELERKNRADRDKLKDRPQSNSKHEAAMKKYLAEIAIDQARFKDRFAKFKPHLEHLNAAQHDQVKQAHAELKAAIPGLS